MLRGIYRLPLLFGKGIFSLDYPSLGQFFPENKKEEKMGDLG